MIGRPSPSRSVCKLTDYRSVLAAASNLDARFSRETPEHSCGEFSRDKRSTSMSTKATIAHGPNFHFYHDLWDEDHVYLEVEGTQFEASYGRVMVPIPVHIWEVIRRHPGVDLQLANKTDDELRQHVEQIVDERLKRYQEAEEHAKGLAALAGSLTFGRADQPREAQLAAGLEHCTRLREHQRQIQQAIAGLEQKGMGK